MYRPEGFDEDRIIAHWATTHTEEPGGVDHTIARQLINAGADAMLEGLKKEGIIQMTVEQRLLVELRRNDKKKGYLVFIPEEKDATE